jgi:hypothetical protein
MYEFKKELERYLRVNLLGPGGPSSYEKKKKIYRAAVSQRLRNPSLCERITFCFLELPIFCCSGGLKRRHSEPVDLEVRALRYLRFQTFVVTNFSTIVSSFRYWFRRIVIMPRG